jgi:F-type H+-transporting ATPase subunit gamma
MEKLADVRARMRSVEGIGEVCRTLATVASAKLAQTRERALGARVYTARLREILARQQRAALIAGEDVRELSPLMEQRSQVRAIDLAVIGADRGLCGGYNLSVGRAARAFAVRQLADGVAVTAVTRGRRVETYLRRATTLPNADATAWTRAGVTDADVDWLLERATQDFLSGQVDEVWACYTAFVSTVRREPTIVRLLPVMPADFATLVSADEGAWQYEPSQKSCVAELLQAFVRLQIEDVLLESFASEQAARMVTMQEAAERADRTLADLRVAYNRLRRESITADLVGVLVAGRVRREVRNDEE